MQRVRWLDSITNSWNMDLNKLLRQRKTGEPGVHSLWVHSKSDMTWGLNNNKGFWLHLTGRIGEHAYCILPEREIYIHFYQHLKILL